MRIAFLFLGEDEGLPLGPKRKCTIDFGVTAEAAESWADVRKELAQAMLMHALPGVVRALADLIGDMFGMDEGETLRIVGRRLIRGDMHRVAAHLLSEKEFAEEVQLAEEIARAKAGVSCSDRFEVDLRAPIIPKAGQDPDEVFVLQGDPPHLLKEYTDTPDGKAQDLVLRLVKYTRVDETPDPTQS